MGRRNLHPRRVPTGHRDELKPVDDPYGYDLGRPLPAEALPIWDNFLCHIGDVVIRAGLDAKVRIVPAATDLYIPLIGREDLEKVAGRRSKSSTKTLLERTLATAHPQGDTGPLDATFRGLQIVKAGKASRLEAKFAGNGIRKDKGDIVDSLNQQPGINLKRQADDIGKLTLARFSTPIPPGIERQIRGGAGILPSVDEQVIFSDPQVIDLMNRNYREVGMRT